METLFEMRDPDEIRTSAIAENRLRVHEVIAQSKPWALSTNQRRVLEILRWHNGKLQAINISDLQARLSLSPREIKSCVRELVVTFRLPIVASRDGEAGGYYFATTADERRDGSANYLKEAVQLIRRAQIIRNEHDIHALLGQVALDLKEGSTE